MKKTINLPQNYLDAMKELLKEDYEDYLASFEEKRLYGLRINTLKISVEDFLKISPFELEPIPWIENGFYFHEEDKPAKHPYYFAGLYYIQEPSAMTPANVLPVEDGDVVFDMCAAPGGKSTELGAKLDRTGLLITNDISNSRAKALLKNVEVFGIPNLCVLSEDPKKIADRFTGFFDKVLIDAPCSGEGMFRRDPVAVQEWSPEHVETCAVRQLAILSSAAQCVREGGILVYSTCTFSTEENEGVVQKFLESHPEFVLEKPNVTFGRPAYGVDAVRIFPMDGGEGHFAARFRRVAPCEERFAPFSFKPDRETQAHAEELYTSLFTDVPGDFIKKPMKECTGKEITEEWLYHLGVPEDQIEDLAEHSAVCVPTMMPYITAFFMPRTKGDRPDVIPDGCVNFAFLGQFTETPRDTVFTTEYSVRTAMEAVYGLLGVDRGVPEVWGSVYDVRELLDSSVKLMDGKSPLQMNLGPLNVIKKPLLGKIRGTVIEKLLRDHDVLRDGMI